MQLERLDHSSHEIPTPTQKEEGDGRGGGGWRGGSGGVWRGRYEQQARGRKSKERLWEKLQWMNVASNGDGTRAKLGETLTGGINK